jgi:DNA-binding response OmpR family regulator
VSELSAHAPPSASDQRSVLVVDDDHHVRRLLIRTLERAGHCVLTATDGDEATRIAREHQPAAVLLDAEMPKTNGFDICRQLKQDPATSRIPILMLTAKAQDEDRARGLDAGADGYIVKPFSPRRLIEELEGWFAR